MVDFFLFTTQILAYAPQIGAYSGGQGILLPSITHFLAFTPRDEDFSGRLLALFLSIAQIWAYAPQIGAYSGG